MTSAEAGPGEIDHSRAGEPLPQFSLTDTQGNTLALGEPANAPMLVNLWATWCAPCIKEMPLLDDLAADYGDRLQVVTISQDLNGAKAVEPFFARNDLPNLPRWLDPETEFAFAVGAGGLPVTLLYDAEGREVWRIAGDYDWSSAEARGAIDEAF